MNMSYANISVTPARRTGNGPLGVEIGVELHDLVGKNLSADFKDETAMGNLSHLALGIGDDEGVGVVPRLPLLRHSMLMVVILSVAYLVVFLLAVVNNSLVVSVIYRNLQMRNVTNYFLANLAVADITVSFIVLPITLLSNIFTEWWFSWFLCKAIPYLQSVVVSASVNTLAAVAVERYCAIFYPQKTVIRPKTACIIIAIIWFVPMCIHLPWGLYYNLEMYPLTSGAMPLVCYPKDFPTKDFERAFFLGGLFLTCYLVPLCFIWSFYAMIGLKVWQRNVSGIRGTRAERNIQRSKIRIVRMLIVVGVFFALSWLPLYAIRTRIYYGSKPLKGMEKDIISVLTPIAQWMGAANSCVNPFIYCYFSEAFRKSIIAILKSRSCCGRIKV